MTYKKIVCTKAPFPTNYTYISIFREDGKFQDQVYTIHAEEVDKWYPAYDLAWYAVDEATDEVEEIDQNEAIDIIFLANL